MCVTVSASVHEPASITSSCYTSRESSLSTALGPCGVTVELVRKVRHILTRPTNVGSLCRDRCPRPASATESPSATWAAIAALTAWLARPLWDQLQAPLVAPWRPIHDLDPLPEVKAEKCPECSCARELSRLVDALDLLSYYRAAVWFLLVLLGTIAGVLLWCLCAGALCVRRAVPVLHQLEALPSETRRAAAPGPVAGPARGPLRPSDLVGR